MHPTKFHYNPTISLDNWVNWVKKRNAADLITNNITEWQTGGVNGKGPNRLSDDSNIDSQNWIIYSILASPIHVLTADSCTRVAPVNSVTMVLKTQTMFLTKNNWVKIETILDG